MRFLQAMLELSIQNDVFGNCQLIINIVQSLNTGLIQGEQFSCFSEEQRKVISINNFESLGSVIGSRDFLADHPDIQEIVFYYPFLQIKVKTQIIKNNLKITL